MPQRLSVGDSTERSFGPTEFHLLLKFDSEALVWRMITHRCFTLNDMRWSPTNCFSSRNLLSDAHLKRWYLSSIIPQFYLLKMKCCAPAYWQKVLPWLPGMINNSCGVLQRGPGMSFLSYCSKDIFLIWNHLKRFLKYGFMYHLETKWVSVWAHVLYYKHLEDRNQVCLFCFLGYITHFG